MKVPIRRVLHDTGVDTVRGIALACISFLLMTIGDAATKWSLPAAGLAGVMIGRAMFGMPTVALLTGRPASPGRWRAGAPAARRWRLVLLRSLVHAVSSVFWYLAWQMGMSLPDGYAIGFVTPLMMTLLAVPMLGERIRWRRAASTRSASPACW